MHVVVVVGVCFHYNIIMTLMCTGALMSGGSVVLSIKTLSNPELGVIIYT